jgi:hypothetical protein
MVVGQDAEAQNSTELRAPSDFSSIARYASALARLVHRGCKGDHESACHCLQFRRNSDLPQASDGTRATSCLREHEPQEPWLFLGGVNRMFEMRRRASSRCSVARWPLGRFTRGRNSRIGCGALGCSCILTADDEGESGKNPWRESMARPFSSSANCSS